MTKVGRREALVLLLGGAACLVGCETHSGFKKPALPENCYWVEFPYAWVCLPLSRPPDEEAQPSLDKEALASSLEWHLFPWDSYGLPYVSREQVL